MSAEFDTHQHMRQVYETRMDWPWTKPVILLRRSSFGFQWCVQRQHEDWMRLIHCPDLCPPEEIERTNKATDFCRDMDRKRRLTALADLPRIETEWGSNVEGAIRSDYGYGAALGFPSGASYKLNAEF